MSEIVFLARVPMPLKARHDTFLKVSVLFLLKDELYQLLCITKKQPIQNLLACQTAFISCNQPNRSGQ